MIRRPPSVKTILGGVLVLTAVAMLAVYVATEPQPAPAPRAYIEGLALDGNGVTTTTPPPLRPAPEPIDIRTVDQGAE